jgi:hypothetical protein
LAHRLLGEASPFAPYIANLPRGVPGLPMFFAGDTLAALQYPPVTQQVKMRCRWLLAFSRDTLAPLRGGPQDPFEGAEVDANALGWALAVVTSRAFRTRGPAQASSAAAAPAAAAGCFGGLLEWRGLACLCRLPGSRCRQKALARDHASWHHMPLCLASHLDEQHAHCVRSSPHRPAVQPASMLPLIDMANHSFTPNAKIAPGPAGSMLMVATRCAPWRRGKHSLHSHVCYIFTTSLREVSNSIFTASLLHL